MKKQPNLRGWAEEEELSLADSHGSSCFSVEFHCDALTVTLPDRSSLHNIWFEMSFK